MKAISFSTIILIGFCFFTNLASAQSDGTSKTSTPKTGTKPNPKPKSSQFNSQIYEKEKSESTFTAQVKIVREIQGDTQVFFLGVQGFYVLNLSASSAGSWQNLLIASQTKKFPVQVTVDTESRLILNVIRSHDEP